MAGAVVSASADAGGHDRAAGLVVAAGPGAGGASGGGASGRGSDSGNAGSQAHAVPSFPADTTGSSDSGGDGGDPQGGQTGGRDGGSGSTPTGVTVPSTGGDRGPGGTGSGSGGNGSGASGSGSSGSPSGGSGGSQDGGASHGRGSGSGNGNSGSGDTGGGAVGGTSGRCSTACHITQQPGSTGTVVFTPAPGLTTSGSTPTPTPTPTPVPRPRPVVQRGHHVQTPSTYSTSATPIGAARPTAATTGLAGVGVTVTPAVRTGVTANGASLPVGTPSSISTLLGSARTIRSSTRADTDSGRTERRAAVTQPIAQQTFIGSIEQAVPESIWLALAAALAFGAVGSGWALYSGHRVRRQSGALAAMSTAALTDQLTGLLNRRGFLEAVERELARARRYGRGFVLAYVDVRGLKGVNDTEGHRAGDELLKEAAGLLQDSARADDVVGRLGGDEMGLLLVEQGADGADAVRRRVESQVPERRTRLGLHSSWDLTIGTAAYPEDGETVDDLLRVADLRLYEQRGIELIERPPAETAEAAS